MATSDLTLLDTLLQDWRELLSLWAQNGTLTRAAQEALQLEAEPEKLRELVGEWSQGDFRNLPPVVLLPASAMPSAAGAYAISTGMIFLNGDWLASASEDRVIAVLTEELGHHLDGLLNASDTPGDEGELFAALVLGESVTPGRIESLRASDDASVLLYQHQEYAIELSAPSDFGINTGSSAYTRFNNDFIALNWGSSNPALGGQGWNNMQCTSYAYGRAIELGYFGNLQGLGAKIRNGAPDDAKDWDNNVGAVGDSAGSWNYVPRRHSIAVWENLGSTGHVAFVESVNYDSSGRVSSYVVSEHNVKFDKRYSSRVINRGTASFSAKFIYLTNDSTTPIPNPPPPPPSTDNRLVLPIFDPAYYLDTYADVRNAYGASNHDGARSHWLQFGIKEGRRGSLVFDPKDYLQRYQDVANAYGATNYAGAISHWLEWGLKDGRRGSQEFDPIYYMAAHPDVEQAYGVKNFSGAISHYYQWGKPGGWYGSEWITDPNAFQLWYYLNNNADVKAVTANANQEVEATRHWYFIGINEGRRGSAELNSKFYLANNPDVRSAYGDGNYRGAIDHYLLFGKTSGRVGANDTPRTLSISDASISEGNNGARELSIVVSLNIVSGETVAVNFNTSNGTAASGSDYSATSGSLSFSPGETSKSVVVQIIGDSTHEGDEIFYVNLSGASNAAITRSQGIGTILNDDPANNAPTALGVSVNSFNENIAAGSTVATLTTTDPDAGNTFTYSLVSGSGDTDNNAFSIAGNQLSIKASPDFETKNSYTIRVRSTDQGGLSFERASAFNVIDVSEPVITFSVSPTSVTEDGASNLVYTFSRTGATTTALTVNYTVGGTATLGTDYTGIAATPAVKTVIFAANSSTATVTVDPTADTTIEANETVALTLATGTGYSNGTTAAVVGTILNDDVPLITLAVSPTAGVAEDGTSNLVYTFSRTGATTTALTVNYTVAGTATLVTDYTGIAATPAVKTVTFAANSATATVTVDPTADTTIEANETVALTLATGTGYSIGTSAAVVGTILNDDVSSTGSYSMGASESSLLLLGTKRINGIGNNLNNTIAGNSGNNRILGLLGADVLTGGGSADSDLFAYNTLSESLLGTGNSFDIITDFNNKDRLLAPLSVETDRLVGSIGNIASLSASTIATLLNSTTFAANSVAAFTATGRTGTFIAMNDSRDGYQPESDAVLFLQNYTVSPANYVDFA